MASSVINSIELAIRNDTPESLAFYLNTLPINSLPLDALNKLTALLLKLTTDFSNKFAAQVIINHIDANTFSINPLPILPSLFINQYIDKDTLSFILSIYPDRSVLDYMIDLINTPDDILAVKTATAISKYFPAMNIDEWKKLYSLTEDIEDYEYTNVMLREFFRSKIEDIERIDKLAVPAAYLLPISTLRTSEVSDISIYNIHKLPSVKQAVDIIMEDMIRRRIINNNMWNELDIIRSSLISQYAISNRLDKTAMLSQIVQFAPEQIIDDNEIFRRFGPVNSIYSLTEDYDFNHQCNRYGGCRMFLCTEFEDKNEEGFELDVMSAYPTLAADWYSGKCDNCTFNIVDRKSAVRQPLLNGGWKGCFCSVKCIRECSKNDDFLSNNINYSLMIDRIEKYLNTIGIYQ